MDETLIVAIITGVTSVLGGGAIVGWVKDRKKDDATALLTNVEALQKQVVLLTSVTDYLRKENAQLAVDRDIEAERNRQLRNRITEIEEELEALRRKVRLLAQGEDTRHAS